MGAGLDLVAVRQRGQPHESSNCPQASNVVAWLKTTANELVATTTELRAMSSVRQISVEDPPLAAVRLSNRHAVKAARSPLQLGPIREIWNGDGYQCSSKNRQRKIDAHPSKTGVEQTSFRQ